MITKVYHEYNEYHNLEMLNQETSYCSRIERHHPIGIYLFEGTYKRKPQSVLK